MYVSIIYNTDIFQFTVRMQNTLFDCHEFGKQNECYFRVPIVWHI